MLLVLPAAALLLLGLNAGLILLGVPMPLIADRLPELHAPLLVFGFVGTLISLERAVALRAGWAYLAPALLAAGMILALTPLPLIVGQATVTVGLVMHLAQYRAIWRRQPMTATAVQGLGAVSGSAAGLAWCGGIPPAFLVPMLSCFLVLTIVGERLELARVAAPGLAAERALFALSLALAAATLLGLVMPSIAVPVAGALLLAIVVWLLRHDIVRATVRQHGLPRYVAICLFTGYAWLVVAGVGWLLGGSRTDGSLFDATTHAVFLGFVITMIMAHAPLILPAVLRVRIPYHPALYAPMALLQLGLLLRVVGGDAWGSLPALQIGGATSAVAMLLFAVTAAAAGLRGRQARATRGAARVAP